MIQNSSLLNSRQDCTVVWLSTRAGAYFPLAGQEIFRAFYAALIFCSTFVSRQKWKDCHQGKRRANEKLLKRIVPQITPIFAEYLGRQGLASITLLLSYKKILN